MADEYFKGPLRQQMETFESADEVSPTSKAAQTIIPGAAYLHTNLEEVFIERKGELMNSKGRFWVGELHNFILLYVPGDEVRFTALDELGYRYVQIWSKEPYDA